MIVPVISVEIKFDHDVVQVRKRTRQLTTILGFSLQDQTRVSTAVSEIARNAFRYAGGGKVLFTFDTDIPQALRIIVQDSGPGIENLQSILDGKYISKTGMGIGLCGSRKLVDKFEIKTGPNGTIVTMRKDLGKFSPHVTQQILAEIVKELSKSTPENPVEEVQSQNQELIRTLDELHLKQIELVESNKELEKERDLREQFVATLTHDLRTPITAAKLTAQILLRRPSDSVQIVKLTERIVASMDRADHMIRDLLDANRLKAGEGIPLTLEECHLDKLLQTVTIDLNVLHGDRFRIQNEIGEISGPWDYTALQRVIENLASNAVKYGRAETPVTISVTQDLEWAEIAVHNQGSALSSADQESIFNPHCRTDSAKRGKQLGWGIGLTLVKGITEAHGGYARVESRPEHGTTFFIRLPRGAKSLHYVGPTDLEK